VRRENARFFHEMVEKALPEGKTAYDRVVDTVVDKELLKNGQDIIRLLAVGRLKDVLNCREDLFHIFPLLRDIWPAIEKNAVVQ
jgi:hypothetical protein